tara:strand:+ start:33 stop:188 length:156 start_codon:yes stop_codon:yes gene_type:complete
MSHFHVQMVGLSIKRIFGLLYEIAKANLSCVSTNTMINPSTKSLLRKTERA